MKFRFRPEHFEKEIVNALELDCRVTAKHYANLANKILEEHEKKRDKLLRKAKRLIGLYFQDASDGRSMECQNWLMELKQLEKDEPCQKK